MSLDTLQRKFALEVENMKKLQKKYQKAINLSSQLDTQYNENLMVKEELEMARADSKVFKLVGPVLVPQTMGEACGNVDRRMDYIKEELKRNSEGLDKIKVELTTQREVVQDLEAQLQRALVKSHAKPAA